MSKITKTMNVKIQIETSSVIWRGEDGDVTNWKAVAYCFGNRIAETSFGIHYKTEKSAITAIQEVIRDLSRLS